MTTDSFIEACDNQKWLKLKYIDVGNNDFVIGFSILIFSKFRLPFTTLIKT